MNRNELPLWMAFTHSKGFSSRRKMNFLIEVLHKNNISLTEAVQQIKENNKLNFNFTEKEWLGLHDSIKELSNYSFLLEDLLNKGIKIIHIMDISYPKTLKQNLKIDAPLLLYCKGNIDLLNQMSLAVVGARKSSERSLQFTNEVVRKAVADQEIIVSGFAKGVDKKALDSALKYHGKSIIVLPQGIDTYTSKTYYPNIVKGDVLVVSTYHPKAPWSVGLAMDRNKIIYGLAQNIVVAESNNSGGTWEGVLNGLKRGREIFVRKPQAEEKNANFILIQKGAKALNQDGSINYDYTPSLSLFEEPKQEYKIIDFTAEAVKYLKNNKGGLTTALLCQHLGLKDNEKTKITKDLSKAKELTRVKKGRAYYYYLVENMSHQQEMQF